MAPSMAPTVLPAHTAPPLTVSRDLVDPRRARMDVPTDFEIIDWISSMHGMDPRVDQGRHLPTAAGICRRRGGSGCGGVSAMDGATELTWTYLQRPPQPDPPRHPAGNQPLLLPLPLLLLLPWPEGLCGCRAQPGRPTPVCACKRLQHFSAKGHLHDTSLPYCAATCVGALAVLKIAPPIA